MMLTDIDRALLSLHTRARELSLNNDSIDHEEITAKAVLAIRSATKIIIDICRRFNMDVAYLDLEALPPPASSATYLAALLHIQLAGENLMSDEWISDMDNLKRALETFNKRWSCGSKFC